MKTLKNTIVLLFIATSFIHSVVIAQDANYKHQMLSINQKGEIKKGEVKVGQITKENVVNDAKGNKIAYIDGQGNLVDAKGQLMGRMGKDGKTYHNVKGDVAFSVKDDGKSCNIYDASGKKIGNIHSSYKGMACVLYCFQNNMDMKDHAQMTGEGKYTCPMHPEVTGKEGDSCPKCHMKLHKVAKK
ncbi:5-fold beta-flower protein [Emticicia sp. SJ17W-69]|uniref:5-fold beta-flower protein n=1 Tax=Emticicia sp. SJ17W-69 TaxID=3421657 RepID=UPI003EB7FF7E